MLSAASRDALAQLEKAGIEACLPTRLTEMRALASVAGQLIPILNRVKVEPAHSDSLQSAWRVLPGLMEDAKCLGLFDRSEDGRLELGLLTLLRAADALCLHDPAARSSLLARDKHLGPGVKTTLANALPYLLDVVRHDDLTTDWLAVYEAIEARATKPAPIAGGQTQVGASLPSGVTLLKPVMRDGKLSMVPTGQMAWRDPDGIVRTGTVGVIRRLQDIVGRAAFYRGAGVDEESKYEGGPDDGGLEEGGPDDEFEEGGPEVGDDAAVSDAGMLAVVWGKASLATARHEPFTGEPVV